MFLAMAAAASILLILNVSVNGLHLSFPLDGSYLSSHGNQGEGLRAEILPSLVVHRFFHVYATICYRPLRPSTGAGIIGVANPIVYCRLE